MAAFRSPLGIGLQNILLPTGTPPISPGAPLGPVPMAPAAQPHHQGFFAEGGMGRLLAGAIGDALAQNAHMQPVFAPAMQQQRQQQQEEVKWQRNRAADNEDWQNRQQYEQTHRPDDEFTRMLRTAGIDPASPQGQQFAMQRLQHQTAEPDVVVTLPNGQLYIGPKSGIGSALGGGMAPTAPPPKHELTPITGGAGGNASGGFPGY